MSIEKNAIPPGTWWRNPLDYMCIIVCVANKAYTERYPMMVVYQFQDGRYQTEFADVWLRDYTIVPNFVPQMTFNQSVQNLTSDPVFRRLYFQIADSVYGLKTRVPQLADMGCTIRLPGAELKLL